MANIELLKIYTLSVDGLSYSVFHSSSPIQLFSYEYVSDRMGTTSLCATLLYPECLDGEWTGREFVVMGESSLSQGGSILSLEKFFLLHKPGSAKKSGDARYEHTLEFQSERDITLSSVYFCDAVSSQASTGDRFQSNNFNVKFFGTLAEFVGRFNDVLAYRGIGSRFSVSIENGITTEEKSVSFDNKTLFEALQEAYKTWNVPFYFLGNAIWFGTSDTSVPQVNFEYGVDKSLLSVVKSNTDSKIVTRCTGYGSDENIPYYYPNPTSKGTLGVVAHTNYQVSPISAVVSNQRKWARATGLGDVLTFGGGNLTMELISAYMNGDESTPQSTGWPVLSVPSFKVPQQVQLTIYGMIRVSGSTYWGKINFSPVLSLTSTSSDTATKDLEERLSFFSLNDVKIDGTSRQYGVTYRSEDTYVGPGGKMLNKDIPDSYSIDARNLAIGSHTVTISATITSEGDTYANTLHPERRGDISGTVNLIAPVASRGGWNDGNGNHYDTGAEMGLTISGTPGLGDTLQQVVNSYIVPATHLMPPVYRSQGGADRWYNALNNTYDKPGGGKYTFENVYNPLSPREYIQEFEDIKPSIAQLVDGSGNHLNVVDNVFFEEGYNVHDTTSDGETLLFRHFFMRLKPLGFNLFDCAIENNDMYVEMTSGDCGGCKFKILVGENDQKNHVQVSNGQLVIVDKRVVCSGEAQAVQNDTTSNYVWLELALDDSTYGGGDYGTMPSLDTTVTPNKGFKPKKCTTPGTTFDGDTFVLTNISLPDAYITNAEQRLEAAIIKFMSENNGEKYTFAIDFSKIYLAENPSVKSAITSHSALNLKYNGVLLPSPLYVKQYRMRVSEGDPLPTISVELSDIVESSSSGLEEKIQSVYGESVSSQEVKKSGFEESDRRYVRKDADDTVSGLLRLKKGFESEGYEAGEGGVGGKFAIDDNGETLFEVDRLSVRKKVTFKEIDIEKIRSVGGKIILSLAQMKCSAIETIATGYKCYFDQSAEDGDAIVNGFTVNDLAICQSFNKNETKYYWRKVVEVGANYIVLSDTDKAQNSDVPSVGDEIVQLGNTSDVARQSAQILSCYGSDTPSHIMYAGINSFSLTGKDVYGVSYIRHTHQTITYGGIVYTRDSSIDAEIDTTQYYGWKNGSSSIYSLSETISVGGNVYGLEEGVSSLLGTITATGEIYSYEPKLYDYGSMYFGHRGKTDDYIEYDNETGTFNIKANVIFKAGQSFNGLDYLKDNLGDGSTIISGGLILTSRIALGTGTPFQIMSGINGVVDTNALGNGIASWFGGPMVDKFASQQTPASYAKSLFRFDGTGYLADGLIKWEYDNGQAKVTINNDVVVGSGSKTIGNIIDSSNFFTVENLPGSQSNEKYLLINPAYKGIVAGFLSAGGIGTIGGGGGSGISAIKIDNDAQFVSISEGVANLNLTGYLAGKNLGFDYVVSNSVATTPNVTTYQGTTGTLAPSSTTHKKIYLVPVTGSSPNLHEEYITIHNNGSYSWECIGSTQADLTGYLNTSNYATTLDPVYLRKDYHGIAAGNLIDNITTPVTGSKWQFSSVVLSSTVGLFPHVDNSNALLTIDRYYNDGELDGKYNSQLGFSSDGDIYYRAYSNELPSSNPTKPWYKILHTGNFVAGTDYVIPSALNAYVLKAGDTMTGNLVIKNANLVLRNGNIDLYCNDSLNASFLSYSYTQNNKYICIGYGTAENGEMDTYLDGKTLKLRTGTNHSLAIDMGDGIVVYRDIVPATSNSKAIGAASNIWSEADVAKWYPTSDRNIFVEYETNGGVGYFKFNGNLVATGFISAGGVSGGSGGGGVSQIKIGTIPYNPDSNGVVTLPSYPTLASLGGASSSDLTNLTNIVSGKITAPSGGSVGNVLKKTANGTEWAAETQGTVTSVKFNGGSPISPVSGVVDLGSGFLTTSNFIAGTNYQAPINDSNKLPYSYISGTPTIPSEVTESTVSGWGFTKNTGTYSKPTGGIPLSDLASSVQNSLGKADTALQSHQSLANYSTTAQMNSAIASALNDYLPKSGGTISGNLTITGSVGASGGVLWIGNIGKLTDGSSRLNILSINNKDILIAPDGTGKLYYGNITDSNEVATKGSLSTYLSLTGGTMLGNLTITNANILLDNTAAIKYFDSSRVQHSIVSYGFDYSFFGNSENDSYLAGGSIYFRTGTGNNTAIASYFGNSNIDFYKETTAKGGFEAQKFLKLANNTDLRNTYLAIHPERASNTNVLPFFSNDLAFIVKRGGSVSLTENGSVFETGNIALCYDGSSTYYSFTNESRTTESVIDVDFSLIDGHTVLDPMVFSYGTMHYLDFGNDSWGFSQVTILKKKNSGNYDAINTIDNSVNNSFVKLYDGSNSNGFNKIRYRLSGGGYPYSKTIVYGGNTYTKESWGDLKISGTTYYRWNNSTYGAIYTTTDVVIGNSSVSSVTIYKWNSTDEVMEPQSGSITDCSRMICFKSTDGLSSYMFDRYSGGDRSGKKAWSDGGVTLYTNSDFKAAVGGTIYQYVDGSMVATGMTVQCVMNGYYAHRIAELGVVCYNSELGRNTFMSRGCDDLVHRSISPFKTDYTLGTHEHLWGEINASKWYPTADRNIFIEYDSNGYFKVNGNLAATGFISAGGVSSGGGNNNGYLICENKESSFTVDASTDCYFVQDPGTITLPASPITGRHFKLYLNDDTFYINPNGKTVYVVLGKTGSREEKVSSFNISDYSNGNDGVYDFVYNGTAWYVTPVADTN